MMAARKEWTTCWPQRAGHLLRHRIRRGERAEPAQPVVRQLDPALLNPPRGTLAGGPNSSRQDPFPQSKLAGCGTVLLDRRHSVLVDERADDQLERSAGVVASWIADQDEG
jgi:hypothetical protein